MEEKKKKRLKRLIDAVTIVAMSSVLVLFYGYIIANDLNTIVFAGIWLISSFVLFVLIVCIAIGYRLKEAYPN